MSNKGDYVSIPFALIDEMRSLSPSKFKNLLVRWSKHPERQSMHNSSLVSQMHEQMQDAVSRLPLP